MAAVTRARPEIGGNEVWTQRVITRLNQIMRGRLNNGGSFTLTAGVATSTISDPLVTSNSIILPIAETANAAAENLYIPRATVTDGQFIVHHANAGSTDRSFSYTVNC